MSKATEILKTYEASEDEEAKQAIQALIDTNFSGSNQEQGKAAALFKGIAFNDSSIANKFMAALDKWTTAQKVDSFK